MLELIEEIRTGQENQTNEFRRRADSLDDRYDKLERLVFEHVTQTQAQGKQAVTDGNRSPMMDPTSAESNRPPDPPDLRRFHQNHHFPNPSAQNQPNPNPPNHYPPNPSPLNQYPPNQSPHHPYPTTHYPPRDRV
ncbi:unnamed protein product [Eruca vesicaria subsp. sativa]|uniref:Uncharacterized protein n=1 Tax=Eruca vesicaria subsp. sativa TaxID=29727 RepID=A0ABC8KAS9_ERUVS|nr:unnamed protein product [Eruca vesicaria subsp. sativa]